MEEDHVHEVKFNEALQVYEVVNGGLDNHTHTLRDLQERNPEKDGLTEEDKETNEEKVVEQCLSLIAAAHREEAESITNGKESYDFYMGEQWDAQQKARNPNRAYITVNETSAAIDYLVGAQSQNRTDAFLKPVENGDPVLADIYNILLKHVMDQTDFIYEQSDSFKDTTITGRGNLQVSVDFSRDIDGDINIRWVPFDNFRLGPHIRKDLSDLEFMVAFDNYSKAKVIQMWPDKENDIEQMFRSAADLDMMKEDTNDVKGMNYLIAKNHDEIDRLDNRPMLNIEAKEVKVFEVTRRVYKKSYIAEVPSLQVTEDLDIYASADVKKLSGIEGVVVNEVNRENRRITHIAGSVLLDDMSEPIADGESVFTTFATYAKKHRSKFHGKVEEVKDTQRNINKGVSLATDVFQRSVSYGWFVDNDTFHSPAEEKKFKMNSSTPGFVQKIKDLSRPPQQLEGTKFPSEVVGLMELNLAAFNRIMGKPPEGMQGNQETSAKALMFKRRQFVMQNQYLFEEQSRTLKRIVGHVIALIKKYWSVEKIIRIVQSPSTQTPEQANSEVNVVSLDGEALRKILATKDDVKFDIVISESIHTETMRDFAFATLSELAQQGLPVPLEQIIEYSPFTNKQALMQAIGQQSKGQASAAEETAAAETFKSLPDDMQQQLFQLGIVPQTIQKMAPEFFKQLQISKIGPQTPEQMQEMQQRQQAQAQQPQQGAVA